MLRNRFMRSATWEKLADEDGYPTKQLFDQMIQYSKGECGLIIPGFMHTLPSGISAEKQTGCFTKKHVEMWKEPI